MEEMSSDSNSSGESSGSITDLSKYIKGIFGEKDATGKDNSKLESAGKAVHEYKELEKDYGGSALGSSNSGAASSQQPMQGMTLSPTKAGKLGFEQGFYGHYLPEHFKKTSIINTKGRVR